MLLHLSNEVLIYNGPLDTFSAFSFESNLGKIKKMLSAHKNPLVEIANRLYEINDCTNSNKKCLNFLPDLKKPICNEDNCYSKIIYCGYTLNTTPKNKYVLSKNKKIYEINKIVKSVEKVYLACQEYPEKENCYEYPIDSSRINIYKCKDIKSNIVFISVEDLYRKLYSMHNKNEISFYPMNRFCL